MGKLKYIWLRFLQGISWHTTPRPVRWLVMFFAFTAIALVIVFVIAITSKLDQSARYTVSATSEFFEYKPDNNVYTGFSIMKAHYSPECDEELGRKTVQNSEITFADDINVFITRFSDRQIRIDLQSSKGKSVGSIEHDFEEEPLPSCASFFIELTEESPIFSMNLIGEVKVGKQLTDAPYGYFPLVLGGEIRVIDHSMINEEPYQLPSFALNTADFIYFNSDTPTKGTVRAEFQSKGMQGVITSVGGSVYVQQYRSPVQRVESSFVSRITSDNELGIALTFLIVFLQLAYACILYLLRIELLEKTQGK